MNDIVIRKVKEELSFVPEEHRESFIEAVLSWYERFFNFFDSRGGEIPVALLLSVVDSEVSGYPYVYPHEEPFEDFLTQLPMDDFGEYYYSIFDLNVSELINFERDIETIMKTLNIFHLKAEECERVTENNPVVEVW